MSLGQKRASEGIGQAHGPLRKKSKSPLPDSAPTAPTLDQYLHLLLKKLVKGQESVNDLVRMCRVKLERDGIADMESEPCLTEYQLMVGIVAQALKHVGV